MSVFKMRGFLWLAMVALVPLPVLGQTPLQGPPAAILHTQGGVWVNGAEARDSTAIFAGDLIETKPTFSASLTLDGTEVMISAESIAKFDGDIMELDHGAVAVGTSKSFKVRVNCLKVVPVVNEWTQYEVSDLNGTVHVAAKKLDVNVEHAIHGKPSAEPQSSQEGSVHESQEKNYDESELCGAAAPPSSAGSGLNPKWIAAGAGGAALLILILAHSGGGKTSVSPSSP
jgi:hypothetical protein